VGRQGCLAPVGASRAALSPEWEGRYLYCALERTRRQEQWAARQAQQQPADDLLAAKALFYSLLTNNSATLRRLESVQWGHGGQQRMAQLFGLGCGHRRPRSARVARRPKCCGGRCGRKVAAARPWKKNAGNPEAAPRLVAEDTAGDPMGRRGVWTGKRLRDISRELAQLACASLNAG